ncbi:hypothetical protein Fmac_029726 [Flemingia macrophylla]|uniref:Uncharacterized protein n=1 Tax=Flemingia macrophylla TaxID=520843 RepID=A0ABD1LB48_9FABA
MLLSSQSQPDMQPHSGNKLSFTCVSNGKTFDVSDKWPILTRLWLTFSTQFRTAIYAQIFKGSEAMHVTWKIQQLRTVNNMEHLQMPHRSQPLRKHLKTITI